MGFEAYTVVLYPHGDSPLSKAQTLSDLQNLVARLQAVFPALETDAVELIHLPYPPRPSEVLLVQTTPTGLFQMQVSLSNQSIRISLRFAYCNPRSIYGPFCDIIGWLMREYCLHGSASADGVLLQDPDTVCDILLPNIEYNRHLWELDAETDQEAILRPGEAIARFIMPKIMPA